MAALEGSELLGKIKELGGASKSELVRACGYVSTKKDGTERLNFTGFYEGILEAKGVALGVASAGDGKSGRKLSYVATVQFNGNLLVGKAYTALMGLTPGEEFTISIHTKKRTIRLAPVGSVPWNGDDDGGEVLAPGQEGEVSGDGSGQALPALTEKDLALAAA